MAFKLHSTDKARHLYFESLSANLLAMEWVINVTFSGLILKLAFASYPKCQADL